MATINSVYRRYNGASFDNIHFQTNVGQVGETPSVRFLKPQTHLVNGKSFYNNGDTGITLYAEDIKLSSSNNTTIKAFLDAFPTSSNMVTAGANIGNGNIPVGNGSKGLTDSGISLQSLKEMAEGKTNSYVTEIFDATSYGESKGLIFSTNIQGISVGDVFTYNMNSMYVPEIPKNSSASYGYRGPWGNIHQYLICVKKNPNNTNQYIITDIIHYSKVKVGDNIYIIDKDYPDLWVSAAGNSIELVKLETQKVDLTNYVTKGTPIYVYNGQDIAYDPEGSYFTPTNNYSHLGDSNLVLRKKYTGSSISSTKEFDDVIASIDANGIEVYWKSSLYDAAHSGDSMNSPIVNYYNFFDPTFAEKYDAYALLSYLSTTPQRFANIDDIKNLKGYVDNQTVSVYLKGASVSGNTLTLTKQDDSTLTFKGTQIFYGSTTPSGANTGDIWIDTN